MRSGSPSLAFFYEKMCKTVLRRDFFFQIYNLRLKTAQNESYPVFTGRGVRRQRQESPGLP